MKQNMRYEIDWCGLRGVELIWEEDRRSIGARGQRVRRKGGFCEVATYSLE